MYFWHFLSLSQISRQKNYLNGSSFPSLITILILCLLQSTKQVKYKKSLVSYKPSSMDIILARLDEDNQWNYKAETRHVPLSLFFLTASASFFPQMVLCGKKRLLLDSSSIVMMMLMLASEASEAAAAQFCRTDILLLLPQTEKLA